MFTQTLTVRESVCVCAKDKLRKRDVKVFYRKLWCLLATTCVHKHCSWSLWKDKVLKKMKCPVASTFLFSHEISRTARILRQVEPIAKGNETTTCINSLCVIDKVNKNMK